MKKAMIGREIGIARNHNLGHEGSILEEILMVGPTKKKLCWNCEGSVSLQEENCPYCGVYLSPSVGEDGMEEQIEELFDPPYRINGEGRTDVPTSPFPIETGLQLVEETKGNDLKKVILPLSMLLSGTVFFLFGLALFLFSRQGVFILQWNGAYWYYYLGFGFMALAVGWKALSESEDQE